MFRVSSALCSGPAAAVPGLPVAPARLPETKTNTMRGRLRLPETMQRRDETLGDCAEFLEGEMGDLPLEKGTWGE